MIYTLLDLVSRYVPHQDKMKKKITRELVTTVLARKPKMCSFLEWKDLKVEIGSLLLFYFVVVAYAALSIWCQILYKRYISVHFSLYFFLLFKQYDPLYSQILRKLSASLLFSLRLCTSGTPVYFFISDCVQAIRLSLLLSLIVFK